MTAASSFQNSAGNIHDASIVYQQGHQQEQNRASVRNTREQNRCFPKGNKRKHDNGGRVLSVQASQRAFNQKLRRTRPFRSLSNRSVICERLVEEKNKKYTEEI